MADKGDTYYCSWKREADGTYVGWEIRDPMLRANARSTRDLMDALGRVIEERYDDQEAALNFDPPLSDDGDPAWFADGFVNLTWNAWFKFRPSAKTAYTGRCERCGGGIGPRSSNPLIIDEMTGPTDGPFSPQSNEPLPNGNMPAHLIIFSEGFLGLLTNEERSTFQIRPVKYEGKQRNPFFEVIPHRLLRSGVIKGLEADGWRCDRCQRRSFSNGSALGWGVQVICKQDLPSSGPKFFFAGDHTDVNLFCTAERLRRLAGNRYARKLMSYGL